jgi:hypothetical protein
MFIEEKDLKVMLGKAECDGVMRARRTLSYIHNEASKTEKDPLKKKWHEEEGSALLDDDKWNLLGGR